MTIKWHIEKRKIDDLKHFENNPRIASKENLNKLNESIKSIGMAQPINITLDNVVLSGNMRLEVLKQQGVKEVEVYVPDTELTEKQQKEIVIRMNSNIAGDWDYDLLNSDWEVEDLEEWGVEVPVIDSILEELDNDCFSSSFKDEADSFSITFNFPLQNKEKIEKVLKQKTKQVITDEIQKLILSYDF